MAGPWPGPSSSRASLGSGEPLRPRRPSPRLACPLHCLSRSCQITSAACWRRPLISLRADRPGGRRPQARIMGRADSAGDLAHGGSCCTGAGPAGLRAGPPRLRPHHAGKGIACSPIPTTAAPARRARPVPPPRRASIAPVTGRRLRVWLRLGGSGIGSAARTFRPGRFNPATCPKWPVPDHGLKGNSVPRGVHGPEFL